jgi:hypothetical protein
MEVFPYSKIIQVLHGARLKYYEQLSKLGRLQILNKILVINSGTDYNLKLL